MSEWRPIGTAPEEQWIYLWQAAVAELRLRVDDSFLGAPYVPVLGRCASSTWCHDKIGLPIEGATHWRPLFEPPRTEP